MVVARALTIAFLGVGGGLALWSRTVDPGAQAMAQAARAFVATLSQPLRQKAQRPLEDAERTQWNFVPGAYAGVLLQDLDDPQRQAAQALLRAALSARGYDKTNAIVQLENVLHEIESRAGRDAAHRDPGRYSLLLFGEPTDDGTWSWRIQGHHVSLRVTVVKGRFASATPAFLGSNPHEQRDGKAAGRRVLGAEEDLARAFLTLCDEEQRAKAVIATDAPADVILGPTRAADFLGKPSGLPWSAMNEGQRAVLWRLIEEYAHNLRAEFADGELARIKQRGVEHIHFAWAGGFERGEGHYYRIHGEHFVIEYDNTQHGANHSHTVWRDLERDFGGDLLRQHLEEHARARK